MKEKRENMPLKNIKKRNGEVKNFDSQKITNAILKAGEATNEFHKDVATDLTLKVLSIAETLFQKELPDVENIQDIVERVLLDSTYKKAAKAYIVYREKRSQVRKLIIDQNLGIMDKYINQNDWKIKENSNMTYSLQGLNNYISSGVTAEYWLNSVYPDNIKDAHKNGDIHIHDLSLLSVYCVGWDLYQLLLQGFRGVPGKVESAPPKHLRSALGQLVNFFYTLQGEAAGAQAVSSFDTFLAPFVYYDNLTFKEVKQALQEFVFNVNIPTRVGFQAPFTNITMDLNIPKYLKNDAVIVGGKAQNKTYGEFQKEADMINKAFAEVMMEGDASGRVFTFPIPTYSITKDFDWDNPNFENIWKMTGRYGIPYFSNFINSNMEPEDVRSMCCRLRIENEKITKGGGLFGAHPLTGSIGVVTINMPRIGYLAKDEEDFFKKLKHNISISKDSLIKKRKTLEQYTENDLYPYAKHYLKEVKQKKGGYWENHFSTIGILGMNEACINFLGENIASEKGLAFSNKVMDYLIEELEKIQKETKSIFNLEATPGEGTTYRFALIDKKKYPEIVCANENAYKTYDAEPFYTNSTHLPVNHTDDMFEALTLQDELQSKYTGGTVFHGFIGEEIKDTEIVKSMVKKISSNFKLPYFTLTPTFSVCQKDGYIKGEEPICPMCGSKTEVYSRVVGYLRPVQQWNNGKQEEFKTRKTYKEVS